MARLIPDDKIPTTAVIGGYWTRSNDIEIDIVGADHGPVARSLLFVGSIKWLENNPFDERDLFELQRHRSLLAAEPVPMIAVSRNGISCQGLHAHYSPHDLIRA